MSAVAAVPYASSKRPEERVTKAVLLGPDHLDRVAREQRAELCAALQRHVPQAQQGPARYASPTPVGSTRATSRATGMSSRGSPAISILDPLAPR